MNKYLQPQESEEGVVMAKDIGLGLQDLKDTLKAELHPVYKN